jgi:hypothetical protein
LRRSIAPALLIAMLAAGAAHAQSNSRSLFPGTLSSSPAPTTGAVPGATLTSPDGNVPRPPGAIRNAPTNEAYPGGTSPTPPAARSAPVAAPSAAPAANPTSMVPPAMGGIAVSARFGRDASQILSGLHWRIYADKPDANGQFRMLKEDRGANPFFVLPPGSYVVHVAVGLASAAKRVQVRADTVREVFELPVGGVRFDGRVGDARISNGHVNFEIYRGSQFEPGEKRPIASDIPPGDIVLLPEGPYHVVSNYGDGNAVMRYDVRVQAGKLTDTRISHRAAVITLKLVSEKGGEAIANTAWSVLTPGGDVIKESIGAFPIVVLAEGEYVVLARNEGKVFNREFKVETGFDREIELIAR